MLPAVMELVFDEDPHHESEDSSHYLDIKFDDEEKSRVFAKVYGQQPEVGREVARRYNAFPDLARAMQDIHAHTSDHKYAMQIASEVLLKHGIRERHPGEDFASTAAMKDLICSIYHDTKEYQVSPGLDMVRGRIERFAEEHDIDLSQEPQPA